VAGAAQAPREIKERKTNCAFMPTLPNVLIGSNDAGLHRYGSVFLPQARADTANELASSSTGLQSTQPE
jgi:hypothetical protein